MTVTQQIEEIVSEVCDKICKYPETAHTPEEWEELVFSDESPCNDCPLNKL